MSSDTDTLNHLIIGRRPPDGVQNGGGLGLLAASGGLSAQDALMWQGLIALDPMHAGTAAATQAVGLFAGPEGNLLLARAIYQDADPERPIYQHVLIPRDVLQMLAGNITALVELTEVSAAALPDDGLLPPLKIPPAPTWTSDKRMVLFSHLLDEYGDFDALLRVLAAALHERGLLVRGFPADLNARLNFVQSIMMLLPSPARPDVTFTTNVNNVPLNRAAIVFTDEDAPESTRWVLDVAQDIYPQGEELNLPYVESLRTMWKGDVKAFVTDLRAMELLASQIMDGYTLKGGLDRVAQRLRLDALVTVGAEVEPAMIKTVLQEFPPQTEALLSRYAEYILRVALAERDIEAVEILGGLMRNQEVITAQIKHQLELMLSDEPDAVYFFIRTLLLDENDEGWLPLLHWAAVISMGVVLQHEPDAETVMTWIKLIANEPPGYQLQNVLHDGVLAAMPLTHTDGELGRRLVTFTARRAPDVTLRLLEDAQLLANMEAPIGDALREYELDAVRDTMETGREVSLILLARALADAPHNRRAAAVFAPPQIDYLWGLHVLEDFSHLPESLQPDTLIHGLIASGRDWLPVESVKVLMTHIISVDERDLFLQVATHLPNPSDLPGLLVAVLSAEGVTGESITDVMRRLQEINLFDQQGALDTLLSVVQVHQWKGEVSLRLAEQVARSLQQNHALVVPFPVLQRLLQLAESAKSDLIAKITARRVVAHIEALTDDAEQIALLAVVSERVAWSNTTRNQVVAWWREYARAQVVARLQAWDKALEGKKALDWARSIAQTMLALRKLMGKRSLEEFADAIGTAYSVLQAFADSFDNRHHPYFDQTTMRDELSARGTELTLDERNILAKNLRELAELITDTAENRSKATLIRREEDIERQLLSGEQSPHSAIDTMRWLSGYLSGLQED